MENKKAEEENAEKKSDVKVTAVDTGRRVNIGVLPEKKVVKRSSLPPKKNVRVIKREDEPAKEKPAEAPKEKAQEPAKKVVMREKELVQSEDKPQEKVAPKIEPMIFDDSGDFAAMLAESEEFDNNISFNVGDKVSGKIVHIGQENIFVALGGKLEAAIATAEFLDDQKNLKVDEGDTISAYVVSVSGGVTLSNNMAQSGVDLAMLEEAQAKKIPVEGKVLGVNKGGFDVQISGKRAFCPVGQIDNKFVEDTSTFVGRTLTFLVERVEEDGRNIVVTRRALLEREKNEKALETLKNLEVGKTFNAVITRVADFGAFADIGGVEGLIPRSEMSHGHIDRVSDVVSSNDRVSVMVLNFEINDEQPSRSRISLSLKNTKDDPYTLYWDKIQPGVTLEGRVVRLESFGAFVQLFEGIDGLIHISELSENRVNHPNEILNVSDPVSVRVIEKDDESKRVALTLKEDVQRKKERDAKNVRVTRGQKVSGTVSRIERYGVFLELEEGGTALLPQSETGLPRNTELGRVYNFGDKVEVAVIDIDQQNRIRVSKIALDKMQERDSFLQFQTKENEGSKFGTFADLFKKKK